MPFPAGKYKFGRQRIDSSTCVQLLRFDLEEELLRVYFTDGSIYEYSGLPEDVYLEFKDAPSRGSYFNAEIRNNYSYTRTG